MRDAQLAPAAFIDWAMALAAEEADDVILAGLLGRVETAFRRYLSDAQRDAIAPRLERGLSQAIPAESPPSRRILLMRAYAALAWTPAGLADLHRLLEGEAVSGR